MLNSAYIPTKDVKLAVMQELNDTQGRYGHPFYMDIIAQATRQMALETGFDIRHWEGNVTEDLIVDCPTMIGMDNNAWLYNGQECNIDRATTLFIKPNMWHKGGAGYLANMRWVNHDGMNMNPGGGIGDYGAQQWWPSGCLHYAGFYRGKLYLSATCARYEKIHITYNGLGSECWGDDVDIPQWAATAITDWAVRQGARRLRWRDPQYTSIIREKNAELEGRDGSWLKAKVAFSRMDNKQRSDMAAYMGRYGHISSYA